MNIYITEANEANLRTMAGLGRSMSGLVNRLLEDHFKELEQRPGFTAKMVFEQPMEPKGASPQPLPEPTYEPVDE